MLYLFNSGYRIEYLRNVLNTLSMPNGSVNTYEYSIQDNYNFVAPSLNKCKKDDDVSIIFIDTESANGYNYYPLRTGKLIKSYKRLEKQYFVVVLYDYLYIENVSLYREKLISNFGTVLRKKNPDDSVTGYLAFYDHALDAFGIKKGNDVWISTVSQVSSCARFVRIYSIFTRFNIIDNDGNEVKICKHNYYKLKMNKSYKAQIDYFINNHDKLPDSSVDVQLCSNKIVFKHPPNIYNMGVKQGIAEYEFSAAKNIKKADLYIKIEHPYMIDMQLLIANRPIDIKISRSRGSNFLLLVVVLLLGLSTYINGMDFTDLTKSISEDYKINNLSNLNKAIFESGLLDICKYYIKPFASTMVALFTFWLVKIYGNNE